MSASLTPKTIPASPYHGRRLGVEKRPDDGDSFLWTTAKERKGKRRGELLRQSVGLRLAVLVCLSLRTQRVFTGRRNKITGGGRTTVLLRLYLSQRKDSLLPAAAWTPDTRPPHQDPRTIKAIVRQWMEYQRWFNREQTDKWRFFSAPRTEPHALHLREKKTNSKRL